MTNKLFMLIAVAVATGGGTIYGMHVERHRLDEIEDKANECVESSKKLDSELTQCVLDWSEEKISQSSKALESQCCKDLDALDDEFELVMQDANECDWRESVAKWEAEDRAAENAAAVNAMYRRMYKEEELGL